MDRFLPSGRLSVLLAALMLAACASLPKEASVVCVRNPDGSGDIICTMETVHEPVINGL